ncbi:MAG TPA: DUF2971 domain-containing protein [Methylophilaceae bacterium]|nr:DUF2971 domain-containing protein [Methylophilaceae bacterium]
MTDKKYSLGRHPTSKGLVAEFAIKRMDYATVKKYLRTPPNKYPRFLYRYIHPDISIERLEEQLIEGDFWLSSCQSFNDPFDMSAKAVMETSVKNKRKRIEALVKDQAPLLKRREFEATVTQLMTAPTFKSERFSEILRKNLDGVGVLCFSEDARNLLMWSHYAQHHKGLVIQVEVAKDPQVLTGAFPVDYSLDYPVYDWFKGDDQQLTTIMLRKHDGWKYEKEHRIIRVGEPNMHLHINPCAITAVIMGCRSDKQLQSKVEGVLEKRKIQGFPDIIRYQAIKHLSQYKLRILSTQKVERPPA